MVEGRIVLDLNRCLARWRIGAAGRQRRYSCRAHMIETPQQHTARMSPHLERALAFEGEARDPFLNDRSATNPTLADELRTLFRSRTGA